MFPKEIAEVTASLRSLVKMNVDSKKKSVIKVERDGQWVRCKRDIHPSGLYCNLRMEG